MTIHSQHNKKGQILSCEHCGMVFKKGYALTEHIRSHTGERPYKCLECGKTFARSWEFSQHRRFHLPADLNHEVERSEESGSFNTISDHSYMTKVILKQYIVIYCRGIL